MTPLLDGRPPSATPRTLLRWVSTSNPFYVLSAALFLAGLRVSFESLDGDAATWGLMSGLAGYTLLLAVTACLLVRFGNVWDDVRTVLLLVVLMFLATSVTFDEVHVLRPARGLVCSLGGLLLAIGVSEGVLRGARLRLPALFRVPYYLILTLFFLYPLALGRLLERPRSEELLWALFSFSAAAGLVFLTLLPAARRGLECVRDNGSPWRWPLYPWALFAVLGLAVPARAFLLCWSMDLPDGRHGDQVIFGLWFLVPFGLAVSLLLLEIGLTAGRRVVQAVALAVPAVLVMLTLFGHRPDPVYQEFLALFTARLGGDPLYLALLTAAGFYLYAALRRTPWAVEALTAVLAALAVVGPHTLYFGEVVPPRAAPLLAAGVVQLALGAWRHSSRRCLVGFAGLVAAAAFGLARLTDDPALPALLAFHLGLLAMLIVGAAFDDVLARALRLVAAVAVLLASALALFAEVEVSRGWPVWLIEVYPPALGILLLVYGRRLRNRPASAVAGLVLTGWLGAACVNGYLRLRLIVAGLDQLALSLAVFAAAVLVSLRKSGILARR